MWAASRLHDHLIEAFPDREVFRDIDNIDPGEDFVEVVEQKLETVDVILVLIGKTWLGRGTRPWA